MIILYIYNQSVICNINLQVTNQDKPILFRNDSVLEPKKNKKQKKERKQDHMSNSLVSCVMVTSCKLCDSDKLCELCDDKLCDDDNSCPQGSAQSLCGHSARGMRL